MSHSRRPAEAVAAQQDSSPTRLVDPDGGDPREQHSVVEFKLAHEYLAGCLRRRTHPGANEADDIAVLELLTNVLEAVSSRGVARVVRHNFEKSADLLKSRRRRNNEASHGAAKAIKG